MVFRSKAWAALSKQLDQSPIPEPEEKILKFRKPILLVGPLVVSMLALSNPASADVQYSNTPQAGYYDFGGAPDSYGTSLAADGARHADGTALYLGPVTDSFGKPGAPIYQTDGIPAPSYGIPATSTGRENGVSFLGSYSQIGGTPCAGGNPLFYWTDCWGKVDVTVTVDRAHYTGGSVFLDGWIDWAHDGSFANTGLEHILSASWDATAVSNWASDTQTFTFWFLDGGGPNGPFYARFRVSESANLATGAKAFGEVEDYGGLLHGQGTPEIDPASSGSALALLVGGFLLMSERRRRSGQTSAL